MKVVYIEWVDSHSGGGQYDLKEVMGSKVDFMRTAGFLVQESDDEVVIVQDFFQINREGEQVRCYMAIPKVNITRMETWEPKG